VTQPRARVWAEIDTAAWRANFEAAARQVSPLSVMPVVKANGYGMGAREAARAFRDAGAQHLAVSCLSEGLELLDVGPEILILGASLDDEIPDALAAGLVPSVQSLRAAECISAEAGRQGRVAKIHVKVDTGMGRFGVPVAEARDAIRAIAQLPHIDLDGVFSHLAAVRAQDRETFDQVARLAGLIEELQADGVRFARRHIANSTAMAGFPPACTAPFNLVRSGIDLHGAHLSIVPRPYETRPVLTLKARLLAVRRLPPGSTVGYGRTYTVTREQGERIGIVSIGYADGYPHALSNKGAMLVRGARRPVTGLVCMDYTMISLEDAPDAEVGDEVVVIGEQGGQYISIPEVARLAQTIPYELMCGLGSRVERRYLK